ncbi:hypothetical protein [Hydrocarboniclastica marina]|uniref:Uncharacterized protein n=1 Tax=Hydrocarboniclastica marina TaxID=2259620 RepID=A0A4P7XEE6_9ALTE|nr:hypothetical protein [Hydrocarboniclastica marina]MAL99609.1 hypothetical protein [Alteromonadaceae bacterium]QCF24985.1 hypothetical protein soil367_02975 [Hydrocarboniclastica marina]|tara:strand:- start:2581 stop:2829 length:249 start_codon:yes stop_codon:yes gene_type:complete
MSMTKTLIFLALAGPLLAGCSDSDGNSSKGGEEPMTLSFTTFVNELFEENGVTAEPESVNNREFAFNDQENEGAFDDLIRQQ